MQLCRKQDSENFPREVHIRMCKATFKMWNENVVLQNI